MYVVTAWLGHSALIAAKHYLQVTDADFEKASRKPDAQSGGQRAGGAAGIRRQSHRPARRRYGRGRKSRQG